MADKKISELDAITGADTAADDFFVVVDTSGSVTKKISRAELNNAIEQDVLSTVDINGGTIDNTVIGGTTAAAGSFTNVTVSGTVDGRDVATDGTKLDGIEATADVTDATNVAGAGALMDSEVTNLAQVKAFDSSDYATAAQGTLAANALPKSGGAMTGAITTNSTFDGRDVSVDGSKLDGIEAGATADQTNAQIRAAVEAATDSNVFTDADHTKLNSIATSATAYSNSDVDTHLNTSTAATSEVLSWTGSDYDWVAQSGGGSALDLFAESYGGSLTKPTAGGLNSVSIGTNAVVTSLGSGINGSKSISIGHNSSITSANAIGVGREATVSGAYASGFGYKATSAGTQSHAATNSYASGTNSFAAAIANNTSSYGATANNSIAMGSLSKSTLAGGVAIGTQASSLASQGVSIGYQNTIYSPNGVGIGTTNSVLGTKGVCLGTSTYVSATYGMAFGFQSRAYQQSQFAFAAGQFATLGDAQGSMYILRVATTDATPTVLTTTGAASASWNQIEVQSDQCLTFDGTITAMQNGAQSYASWRVEGLLVNDGGTTTVANSAITVIDNQSSWGLTLTADNTNKCLAITFTGEAGHNIRTVANIRTSEVTYA